MLVFGLTGGIGTGKSTVAELFMNKGIYVVDTDRLARKVAEPGTQCLAELVGMFGEGILNPDGTLNRRGLAEIVFSDQESLKVLNRITHHYIKYAIIHELNAVKADYAAIDGAVIIGSPVEKLCQFMVTVDAREDIRIERVHSRDNLTDEKIKKRIRSQMSSDEYRAHAKYVIENNGTLEELRDRVYEIADEIKSNG